MTNYNLSNKTFFLQNQIFSVLEYSGSSAVFFELYITKMYSKIYIFKMEMTQKIHF